MGKKEQPRDLSVQMEAFLQWLAELIYQFGRFSYYVGIQTVRIIARGVRRIRRFFRPLWNLLQRMYYKTIGYRWDIEKEEWRSMRRSILLSKRKLQYARSCGFRYFCKILFRSLHVGLVRYKNLFAQLGNVVLPILCVTICVLGISFGVNRNIAMRMEYNGQVLGYVKDETLFTEATDMASARLGSNIEFSLNSMPVYTMEFVGKDVEYVTKNALCDAIINNLKTSAVKATGLYVNGEYVTATASELDMKVILQSILKEHETGIEGESVKFADQVQITEGYYAESSVKNADEVQAKLTSKEKVEEYYTVVKGDTVPGIAKKFNMTTAQLQNLNPTMDTKLIRIGQKILVSAARSTLPVHTVKTVTYKEDVAYKVERINSSSLYVGESRLKVTGKKGQVQKTDLVTYQDGVEISRENVETVTLKEPVTQQLLVGTKKRPTQHSTQPSTGRYIWPVPASRIISKGFRWGSHNAIDIQAPTGSLVLAADAGVVEFAYRDAGLGWYMCLRHDDGSRTYYAHCNRLIVTVGDRVSQGTTIAYVGRTGYYATGPHLHFQVKLPSGVFVNPRNYAG